MTPFLLDVNLLLAISDPMHIHARAARRWFAATGQQGWATCPLTENGFVRVASQPSYHNRPGDAPIVLEALRKLCAVSGHQFWPDDVSLRDALAPATSFTHNQLTDIYLLALAVHHGGKLATLDRRIPPSLVAGGADALVVVPS